MIEEINTPPCSVAWFQRELDRACRAFGNEVKLRIVWAPNQIVARVVHEDGSTQEYKKYPALRQGDYRKFIKGYWFLREVNGKPERVAYQKQGKLVPSNVKPTDVIELDVVRLSPAVHLWVIEQKLPDEYARRVHEEKAALCRRNLGFNLFGEFPKEGVWNWVADVSFHKPDLMIAGVRVSCCELAAEQGVRCQGLYRDPGEEDLQRVRRALKTFYSQPNVEDKSALIAQGAKDLTAEIEEYEGNALLEILKEVRECNELDEIAQGRTRVVGGVNPPLHRTAY